jgi:hypothetical protein
VSFRNLRQQGVDDVAHPSHEGVAGIRLDHVKEVLRPLVRRLVDAVPEAHLDGELLPPRQGYKEGGTLWVGDGEGMRAGIGDPT